MVLLTAVVMLHGLGVPPPDLDLDLIRTKPFDHEMFLGGYVSRECQGVGGKDDLEDHKKPPPPGIFQFHCSREHHIIVKPFTLLFLKLMFFNHLLE